MLDSELVPSIPQCLADCHESHPEHTFRNPNQTRGEVPELREGGRAPRHVEPGPNTAPDKLCQNTIEEDVIHVLQLTKWTTIIPGPLRLRI